MKKFKFVIRGNNYDVDILNIEDDIAEIEVNGASFQVEIVKQKKETKTPKLTRSAVIPSAEADRAKTSRPTESKGAGHIKAPLPGVILEVKAKEGDVVKVGDTIMIMEAMKMENNIKADKEGKILSLKVKAGDSVLEGDVLAEIGG